MTEQNYMIGNWVLIPEHLGCGKYSKAKIPHQLTAISEFHGVENNEDDEYGGFKFGFDDIEPIKLTNKNISICNPLLNTKGEWLIDRFLLIWKPSYKYFYVVCAYSHAYMTKIDTVHHLQNFFQVMNEEELKINIE